MAPIWFFFNHVLFYLGLNIGRITKFLGPGPKEQWHDYSCFWSDRHIDNSKSKRSPKDSTHWLPFEKIFWQKGKIPGYKSHTAFVIWYCRKVNFHFSGTNFKGRRRSKSYSMYSHSSTASSLTYIFDAGNYSTSLQNINPGSHASTTDCLLLLLASVWNMLNFLCKILVDFK